MRSLWVGGFGTPTIGPTELIIVLLIIMFVFGAGKLPEVGSPLGKEIWRC
jgi:TatA/E family protein of Tat protein translocase